MNAALQTQLSLPSTWLAFGLALAFFAALFSLAALLAKRGRIGPSLRRMAGWCLLLTLLSGLDGLMDQAGLFARFSHVAIGLALAFVIVQAINFVSRDILAARIRKRPVNQIHVDLIKFAVLVIYAFGFFKLALDVDVGSLFTSSAILTAVAALSMQDTIGALIAGLVLQLEKPFASGDFISVGGFEGKFVESTWRHTTVLTPDMNTVLIPNNLITKERLLNLSKPIPEYRLHLVVPAPLDAAPVKVKAALEEVLAKAPVVRKHPAPLVRLKEFADSRALYELLFYVRDFDEAGRGRDEVLSQVWYQFKKDGIGLPIPAREVKIKRPAAAKRGAEIVAMLRKVPLFAGLPEADLDLLAAASALTAHAPGDSVVAEGETGATLFIILDGEVAVTRAGQQIATLGPGDFFGEMALLTGEPRQAGVRALARAQCLEVDREGFRVILENNPQIVSLVQDIFASRGGAAAECDGCDKSQADQTLFQRFLKVFTKG